MNVESANVAVHVAAGSLGLLVGVAAMVAAKGGDAHRRVGRVFVALSGVTLVTALVGVLLFSPPTALIAATLTAAYQWTASLRTLALTARGPGLLDTGLALAALVGCGWILVDMNAGTRSWSPAIGYATVGALALFACYDLSRPLWAARWLATVRPYDHGVKMLGAWSAMASAGMGNMARDWQPWSQIGPTIAGTGIAIVLCVLHARRRAP
jgi:hypothetical protein